MSENAYYMFGSSLIHCIALDTMDLLFAASAAIGTCGRILGRCDQLLVPSQSITDRLLHGRWLCWRRDNKIVNNSWSVVA